MKEQVKSLQDQKNEEETGKLSEKKNQCKDIKEDLKS